MVEVPPLVRAKAMAAGAERWLDGAAIREWVVERDATGLECAGIGLQPVGREMLAAADAVAAVR